MRTLAFDTSSNYCAVAVLERDSICGEVCVDVRGQHAETLLPNVQQMLDSTATTLEHVELIAVGLGPGSFTGLRVGLATAHGISLPREIPIVGVSSLSVVAAQVLDTLAPDHRLQDRRLQDRRPQDRRPQDWRPAVVSVTKAYRGEVYAAAYAVSTKSGEPERERVGDVVAGPWHGKPSDFGAWLVGTGPFGTGPFGTGPFGTGPGAPNEPVFIGGDGAELYREEITCGLGDHATSFLWASPIEAPSAGELGRQGRARWANGASGADVASDNANLEPHYVRPSDARRPA